MKQAQAKAVCTNLIVKYFDNDEERYYCIKANKFVLIKGCRSAKCRVDEIDQELWKRWSKYYE